MDWLATEIVMTLVTVWLKYYLYTLWTNYPDISMFKKNSADVDTYS